MARRRVPTAAKALAAVIVACGVAVAGALVWADRTSPSVGDLRVRVARIDRSVGATPVPLPRVAPVLRAAVVATEDERFYRHRGVDLLGILRAVPYDVVHLDLAQGASTITEQLAKDVYLGGSDRSIRRKLHEIALGFEIGRHDSRSVVLDDYLNSVYFGDGQWGIENASRHDFGRSAARLTLAQASLLAGLIQAPSSYDPLQHPAAARARQIQVLQSMVRNHDVSPAAASAVVARPLALAGGGSIPAEAGVVFSSGASIRLLDLAAGAVLLVAALAAVALARLRPGRLLPTVAWTAAALLVLAAVVVSIRAVQVV